MASYPHVFEYPYSAVDNVPFDMKGNWHGRFCKNDHPIVLELGCGRGEYTVGLGRMFPEKNFLSLIHIYRYAVDKKMREHLRGEVARRKGVSPQKPMNRKIEGEGEGDLSHFFLYSIENGRIMDTATLI